MTQIATAGAGGVTAESPAASSPGRASWPWVAVSAVAAVALAVLPAVGADSLLRTFTAVFLFATLAQAWNVIGGLAGYASFGNVVFFGLGGYTVAVMTAKAGWGFWPALLLAVVIGAAFAAVFGTPILRLKGHYFAIATLGLAEGVRAVVLNVPTITGGGAGISVPAIGAQAAITYPGNTGFYYYGLVLASVTLVIAWLISTSRFGYALRAIHMDEDAAAAVGINTTRAKVAAFTVSGAITAAAGAIFAFQQVTIYPERLFSVEITVLMVVMAVIGGTGTVAGPVIGAFLLQLLSEYLRRRYLGLHLVVFGAVIIVAVIVLPQGLVRFASDAWRTKRFGVMDNIRRYRL